MKQAFHSLTVPTKGPGLYEFTDEAKAFVRDQKIEDGLLTCFVRHTSASLLIQENADPDVQKDLRDFFAHLARNGMNYRHTAEGPDDMPSPAGAGHLAGDLCLRASRRAPPARSDAASYRKLVG
jgi:secondary thiamine-phosphate synthase enzyme